MRANHDPGGGSRRLVWRTGAAAPMTSRRCMVPLAHLGCGPELLLAAGGSLHRRQVEPGGEVAPFAERLHRWSKNQSSVERVGLLVTDVEIQRLHYAGTRKAWRDRFAASVPASRNRNEIILKECILPATEKVKLQTLLGSYPNTNPIKNGEVTSDLVDFEFADIKVANEGFKPLVREQRFDVSELAIVTYLQAKAYDKPYVLMPIVVVARGQHHTIAYNPERGMLKPSELAGKRVGIRAYSVTTGVWVRGILQEQYGVDLDAVKWVTFEDPHVAEYTDPPAMKRADGKKTIVQMLLDGEIDAAVLGDKLPDPRLRHLVPDHDAAAKTWADKHGAPINHMLVIRNRLSQTRPDIVRDVFRMFKESRDIAIRSGNKNVEQLKFGVEPNRRSLETIIGLAFEQKLIPRRFRVDELFDDTTRGLS
jgi:4,5-dihydroxyphthalate decarboxylase